MTLPCIKFLNCSTVFRLLVIGSSLFLLYHHSLNNLFASPETIPVVHVAVRIRGTNTNLPNIPLIWKNGCGNTRGGNTGVGGIAIFNRLCQESGSCSFGAHYNCFGCGEGNPDHPHQLYVDHPENVGLTNCSMINFWFGNNGRQIKYTFEDEDHKGIECDLPAVPISGRIIDSENHSGVADIEVQVYTPANGGKTQKTTTDASGRFTVSNLVSQGQAYAVRIQGNEANPRSAPNGYVPPARTTNNTQSKLNCAAGNQTLGSTSYECQTAGDNDCGGAVIDGSTGHCDFEYTSQPVCNFSICANGKCATPTTPLEGVSIFKPDFTNTSEHASRYFWDFGDGSSYGETNEKTYPGVQGHAFSNILPDKTIYTVTLTAKNDYGDKAVCSLPVTVFPLTPAWYQVIEGSVHADYRLTVNPIAIGNPIPVSSCSMTSIPICIPSFFQQGNYKGVLTYGGGGVSLNPGTITDNFTPVQNGSAKGILTGSGQYEGFRANYDYWSKKLNGVAHNDWNPSSAPGRSGVFRSIGSEEAVITVNGSSWSDDSMGGRQIVILHKGDMVIGDDIVVPVNSAIMFVSGGTISVKPEVKRLQGIYIANRFITKTAGLQTDEQLLLEGSFIGWDTVSLNRNLGTMVNWTKPSELIKYRPDIVQALRNSNNAEIQTLKEYPITWQEVAP